MRQNLQDVVNVERRLRMRGSASSIGQECVSIIVIRLNQPEDYTVPRRIHSGAVNSCPRKEIVSGKENNDDRRVRRRNPRGPIACAISRNIRTISSKHDSRASRNRIPQRQQASRRSHRRIPRAKFEALGGRTQLHRSNDFGDSLQIDFAGNANRKPVLLLGHYDTVYPLGTLANMPCKIENGRLRGPGVLDMKSGIALMLHAIEALQAWHGELPRPVTVFLVSDEEVGSHSSRKITEALAKESAGVLVLEPAAGLRGAVKTARKGVGEYTLRVKGVAAHAGLDPGKGHSAILELARQITVIAKLNNLRQGLSVNPGVIQGGTRTNVIAAEASRAHRCAHQERETSRRHRPQTALSKTIRQTLQTRDDRQHQPPPHGANRRSSGTLQESSRRLPAR